MDNVLVNISTLYTYMFIIPLNIVHQTDIYESYERYICAKTGVLNRKLCHMKSFKIKTITHVEICQ